MWAFAGPGFLVAVGYMDPGNWATDLAGGAKFGYTLLFVVMVSNLIAMTTHGHRLIGDMLFGSTIHKVRHKATMPVLLVRAAPM